MTVNQADPAPPQRSAKKAPGATTLLLARLALYWEKFWPKVLPALLIPYIIIVFSLLGLWAYAPAWLHAGLLALAATAFLWRLRAAWRASPFPTRRDGQRRLERDGRAPHAPLRALDDRPFNAEADNPLWRAHLKASAERARAARLTPPKPDATSTDPYGFRFIALGIFCIGLIAAGDDWRGRLAAGFSPSSAAGPILADIWIEPPAYTGRAPVYLMRAGQLVGQDQTQFNVPEGSTFIALAHGAGGARLSFMTSDERIAVRFGAQGASRRADYLLAESGVMRTHLGGARFDWKLGILEDTPPLVAFTQTPRVDEEGRIAFSYALEDDYSAPQAELEIRLNPDQSRPLDAPRIDEAALGVMRRYPLDPPNIAAGERMASLNLETDPWAGLEVLMRIIITDGAGQTGTSEDASLTLPTRPFFNPVAKAVIEQRQTLAVAPNDWARVGRSLDAITLAPDSFAKDASEYLLLRTAFWRVMRQDGEGFEDAVSAFWPLALQLEDEALELARQRMLAAQDALREALERGASEEEIARLTEELRAAMNQYIDALAQSGQPSNERSGQSAEQLNQGDLDQMLDSIRDLAQSGANNAARQLLSDLENFLNNMRLTQGGGGQGESGQGASGEEGREGGLPGAAGEIISRQRELADEAFQRSREFGAGGDDLAAEEGALGRALDQLTERLGEDGAAGDPNGAAARAFGDARDNIREAQEALTNEDFDAAVNAMQRAIEDLRAGAENLAGSEAQGDNEGENGQRAGGEVDPLGRNINPQGPSGVDVPGLSEAGRSRAIIQDLRNRLGEPGRTQEEIDYLERLLERF